jgi:hypothetical protein
VDHDFKGLAEDERAQGFIAFALMSQWDAWVKRRVEKIAFASESSVRRRVSVDFRQHVRLFPVPPMTWNDRPVHYVPLAMLEKKPFADFDLRDESSTVVPLLTRRKNATLGAAVLTAFAQNLIWTKLQPDLTAASSPFEAASEILQGPTIQTAFDIRISPELERRFYDLCYLAYADPREP